MKTKLFKKVALAKRRRLQRATGPVETAKVSESPPPLDVKGLEVDAKTKDTAEKLAKFVAQMGPEVEQFSKENSESNPEFWFLKQKESSAYKYYQTKVAEFRKTDAKEKQTEKQAEKKTEA
ncbi:SURP domain-containing protein, partial [Escherichia coli]|uniref:SWAP/Surp domain-containing protein n=2 Tax=cellular organisms TaxID=131567 RepID=UPI001585C3FD